jgi:hypothetical protein
MAVPRGSKKNGRVQRALSSTMMKSLLVWRVGWQGRPSHPLLLQQAKQSNRHTVLAQQPRRMISRNR